MNTSLTTFDGYPRDDIDVAQSTKKVQRKSYGADTKLVRTTRARIIYLKNDYKELMNRIEKGLHQHHASAQGSEDSKEAQSLSTQHTGEEDTQIPSRTTLDPPFAKVNSVAPSSPGQEAGLKVGDKIRNFGAVNWRNHENLRKVAEVVQRSGGVGQIGSIRFVQRLINSFQRTILVKMLREDASQQSCQEFDLHLTPRSGWGGRGTLGCHLLPI